MSNVFDINSNELINELAKILIKNPETEVPEWVDYVKTGADKERPVDDGKLFWSIRIAAILRTIYVHGNVGVSRLRTKYGSRKNRGVKPDAFKKTGGKNIRLMLQQLEKMGYVKIVKGEGREITSEGMSLVDKTANSLIKNKKVGIKN